jgi:hypothetical protein
MRWPSLKPPTISIRDRTTGAEGLVDIGASVTDGRALSLNPNSGRPGMRLQTLETGEKDGVVDQLGWIVEL